ncbi:hypothetical protein SPHINGO8AM_50050 [Sphingomonas sp. 8AM]|nr:hypothetical protein SPHINGO8AM_50050 [Sphingomonas sp. 8AM]
MEDTSASMSDFGVVFRRVALRFRARLELGEAGECRPRHKYESQKGAAKG